MSEANNGSDSKIPGAFDWRIRGALDETAKLKSTISKDGQKLREERRTGIAPHLRPGRGQR